MFINPDKLVNPILGPGHYRAKADEAISIDQAPLAAENSSERCVVFSKYAA